MGFLKKPCFFFEYLRKEGKRKRREEKEEMKGCDCERIFWDDFLAFLLFLLAFAFCC